MSEGAAEGAAGPEVVQLDLASDSLGAFGVLMDALAPEEEGTPASGDEGGAASAGDTPVAGAAEAGSTPAGGGAEAGAVAGPAGDTAGGPAAPVAGEPVVDAGAGGAGAAPTLDATTLIPKLGELTTKIETKVAEQHHAAALAEVRGEHEPYFKALEKHPRLLVGTQVPRANGEGTETLKDVKDAENWQDAIKSLLAEEVQSRAMAAIETQTSFLETVNNSVKLFQDNPDLIPNTKQFDKELADRFATLAKPYETRVEGKLMGYAIPVQPLVESLRTTLQAERSAKAPAPAAPAAAPAAAGASGTPEVAPPPKPEDLPQEGISNKAGSGGGEKEEEFSTLFGTIGLPDFRI